MKRILPIQTDKSPAILIVEDDPDQSDMLREGLQDEGFHVETAFSGDTALKKLSANKYNLIILDIRLPGVPGTEVLRSLRERLSRTQLPVVVVSAFATDIDANRYQTLGANACISKPYDMSELIKTARKFLVPDESAPKQS